MQWNTRIGLYTAILLAPSYAVGLRALRYRLCIVTMLAQCNFVTAVNFGTTSLAYKVARVCRSHDSRLVYSEALSPNETARPPYENRAVRS